MPKKVSKPKKYPKQKKISKPKKGQNAKKASGSKSPAISTLQGKSLKLIASKPDGLYQSELRKLLEVDSAKCSKIVARLERAGQIFREPADFDSRRTYLIRIKNGLERSVVAETPDVAEESDDAKEPGVDAPCNIIWPSCSLPAMDSPLYHIDTYLTEFYLLYLIRGRTSA